MKNYRFDVQAETQSLIGSEIVLAATHKNTRGCASTLKQHVFSSEKNIESISWTEMVQPHSFSIWGKYKSEILFGHNCGIDNCKVMNCQIGCYDLSITMCVAS